ncbi:HK97 gp10 family phage protein [Anatilimnocola floriformis]|uniref:HK97 gp10 family phage protein n=1 Tax=Anatilimnocola floriformis TaxID=2948575 RepID=UPI0020C5A9D8|nr:HK97 gp10 family phage protein [Anatilimnocola floriformis]
MAVVIRGAREFEIKLGKLGKNAKKFLRKGTRKAAKLIQTKTKQNLEEREQPPDDSGDLERGVKVKALKRKRGRVGHRVTSTLPKGKQYNMAQEYGWTTKSGRKMPGKRHMRDAGETEEQAALDAVNESLDDAIRSQF